jgi:hypothetical protein
MSPTTVTTAPAITAAVSVGTPFGKPQLQNERKKAFHPDSIDVRFARWAAKNPDIIRLLLKFALEAKQAGFNRFGIAAIVERARWEVNFVSRGDEPFKISNDFKSRLARLLMEMEPTLEGFFELRELRSRRQKRRA